MKPEGRGWPRDVPRDVVICGLPCSGNNLIKRLIRHLTDDELVVGIWHGTKGNARQEPLPEPVINGGARMIIPVRCHACMKKSQERRYMTRFKTPTDELQARQAVLALSVKYGMLVKMVSYEATVRDPEAVGKDLADWLGLEWKGWPEEVTDENAKYG